MKMLIAIVTFLALIAIGPWAIRQWQSLPQSPPQRPPHINISRTQYEQALAKWQAQHVEEYEITTETQAFLGEVLTVRVTDFGNKMEELSPNPQPPEKMTAGDTKYLSRFTIEGMFAQIDTIVREEENPLQSGVLAGKEGCYMANSIDFDPILGYPKRLNEQPVTDCPTDVDWDEMVTHLKIIKSS
jgi:hypothetical protein